MKFYDSDEYRATKEWPYAISAGCIVYRSNSKNQIEVLLLERERNHSHNTINEQSYNLPKGHLGFDETPEQCAMRETREEAGVAVEVETYLGSLERTFTHPVYHVTTQKAVHYFVARYIKELTTMDAEHDKKLWVSPDEAEKLLGQPNPKGEDEIVRRLQQFLKIRNEQPNSTN